MDKYKVVIIGAGPSGIATALNLKKLNIDDVLIIEKYKFPRYKCCAGYITNKTKKEYEKLGLNLEKCNYSLIKDFNIFYKLKNKQNIENKFLYTNKNIDRVELDYNFYKLAKLKKIKILENTFIKDHNINENMILLSNNKKIFYSYLIFADGTNGYGSKYQISKRKNIAMQVVFPTKRKEEIQIHFGITKKGYGWVSSYNNTINVGLTDIFDPNVNYKKKMQEFLEELNLKADMKDLKGAFTPIGIKNPIINNNIYFVGDAVGACDPLTLSGLRYGMNTAKYVSFAIKNNDNRIYLKYINTLRFKFFLMQLLQKVFYLKPTLFCIFEIGCRFFHKFISYIFNNFFVNKK